MWSRLAVLFLALTVSLAAAMEEKNGPMVAFLCNRPSMYHTDNGWVKDDNTGCLRDPVDILNYCRKVFPLLDVRNVVEASEKVTIDNWCAFGHKTCRHQFTVQPFRCLVGPFQSDALLVPEHCIFDHIHDSKLCTSFAEWNKTASRSCLGRSMYLQSFSMLQPCGIDRFNGVEFVCCPHDSAAAAVASRDEDEDEEFIDKKDIAREPVTKRVVPLPTTTTAAPVVHDPMSAYVNRPRDKEATGKKGTHKWHEHDYFVKAMEDMKRYHEERINKIMKEWSAARQRVQELKSRDPRAAERLNKEITVRFQKTYDALEVESLSEKKQLSNLHQQRVQAELNERKRRALDDYMQAIDESRDPAEILRSLKHYIKVVQKDRLHTVNRYKHLRDTYPAEAEEQRSDMANHLRTIDHQMTVALAMMDRVPKYKKKIQLQIDEYLDAYHAVDSSVGILLKSIAPKLTSTLPPPRKAIDEYIDDDSSHDENESESESESESEDEAEREERENEAEWEEREKKAYNQKKKNLEAAEPVEGISASSEKRSDSWPVNKKVGGREDVAQATVKPVVIKVEEEDLPQIVKDDYEDEKEYEDEDDDEDEDEDDESFDSDYEEDEDESYEDDDSKDDGEDHGDAAKPETPRKFAKKDYYIPSRELDMSDHDFLQDAEPAMVDKSYLNAKEAYINKASIKGANSFNTAVPLGITVGVITVLVVIFAGVVIMRRRSNRRARNTAVKVRLDPAATPEERHIAAMQMSGYENPTYKYFEMSGGSASA